MPSFIVPQNGDDAVAEHVAQIVEDFQGLRNIPLSASGINDAAAYALTLRNAGTGSKGLIIYAADGTTVLLQVDGSGVQASTGGGAAAPLSTTPGVGTITSAMFASTVRPSARVYHNANQSIPNTTATTLAFNSERWDTDTIHDTVTNNGRLTCRTAGKYQVTVQVRWGTNTTGYIELRITMNTVPVAKDTRQVMSPASEDMFQQITTLVDMAVNDYVEAVVYQNSTATALVKPDSSSASDFMMVRVA